MYRFLNLMCIAVFSFMFFSCDSGGNNNNSTDQCGDNFRDINEECDGNDLNNRTCQEMGYYGGSLKCDETCRFDTTSCAASGYCGDNIVNGEEECDGAELNQKSCALLGYLGGGNLKCDENCMFDKSECLGDGLCGNDTVDSTEEECDGNDFVGKTCITLGYYGGTLNCNSLCQIDMSECIAAGKCGDGIIHDAYNEQCDTSNLNGQTCMTLGYNGGELSCDSNCHFDISDCEASGQCGDGVIQSDYEDCDGNVMGADTCITLGYYGGFLTCAGNCHYELTECRNAGWCGDGIIQSDKEQCDSSDLNSETCETLGYHGGTLICSNDCDFDISDCETFGRCGDGAVQPSYEECDASDYALDCADLGYQPDQPSNCSDDCNIDVSTCKTKWIYLTAGASSVCGLKSDNGLYCWGYNGYGQLGTGTTVNQNFPSQTGTDTDWTTVSLLFLHTCAVKTNGTLYCWGYNDYGQLGLGDTNHRHSPVQVGSDENWSYVSTGRNHTCAVKNGGELYCWGRNIYGQLGIGNTASKNVPVQTGTDTDWDKISAGEYSVCGLKTDGSLYCWGGNTTGQLGLGDTEHRYSPVQVGTDTDWNIISLSRYHTCAVKNGGELYCWGSNSEGQLGLGNTSEYHSPVRVGTDTDWAYTNTGVVHTCAVKTGGTLYCWGANYAGQLGTGDTNNHYSPVQVGTDTDWAYVMAGEQYTCGLKTDGTLYCWGDNGSGQLGTGNNVSHYLPERVLF